MVDYMVSETILDDLKSQNFSFIAHVDDIDLLNYPEENYVHASIPLYDLIDHIPVAAARKIASTHCIPGSSAYTKSVLKDLFKTHSCSQCASHLSVFMEIPEKPITKLRNEQ